jgi:hypothetical protein
VTQLTRSPSNPVRLNLAWIVVMGDVTIPITGPPGGSYQATLVVLVETTRPKWVVGFTMAPGVLSS